jgi:hypothetical protein
MATVLSPAESLMLLKPNRTPAREAVKVTLLWLLAQGLLRIEEATEKRFFLNRKIACVRPTGRIARLPPHAASLMEVVREAQPDGGTMRHLVARAREAYGPQLEGFKREFIAPALVRRGLIEEGRVLLLFRTWRLTPAGVAARDGIEGDIRRARGIPALLRSNPAEAVAIALAIGGTLLLVEELRPHYRRLSDAMRAQDAASGDAGGDGSSATWSSDDPHPHDKDLPADNLNLHDAGTGGFDLGHLDLGAFDAEAFGALDAGMATFDSSFDASAGGDGGGGDGGGGDGGGGGGD